MSVIDEIKSMQEEGKTDQEIIQQLQSEGISDDEISNSLSESRIKDAVSAPSSNEEMIPSIMTESAPEAEIGEQFAQQQAPAPEEAPEYAPAPEEEYAQAYPPAYAQYPEQGYQYPVYQPTGLSPETITEIAEQAIQEKLEETREKLQQVSSFKTTIEANVQNIDERLKRIEKVIDRLQLSVLQKVGDYVNNVDDIRKELIETQKSFKSLVPELKKTAAPSAPSQKSHGQKREMP